MKERAFVIAAFGDRKKNIHRLYKNIRQYFDYPVHIITTYEECNSPKGIVLPDDNISFEYVERHWCSTGHPREAIRNSNYHKIKFAIDHHYDSLCLLDDDMFIVNESFADGFAIAERFGAAVPLNPRVYVKYNAMGADVRGKDLEELMDSPYYAPACNFSPFFVYPHANYVGGFLHRLLIELRDNPCRGTLAIWKVSWESGYSPVYLPEQWCVCASNAEHIKNHKEQLKGQQMPIPIMALHLGHEQVRKVFGID